MSLGSAHASPTRSRDQDLDSVVRELYERYPLLKALALTSDGAENGKDGVPPFLGMLLSTAEVREVGASCILLPSRERIGFALALLAALTDLERSFKELELDRLTTPLRPGSLVRVAPADRVFEVVEDGKELKGRRWILLRNPTDDQTHYLPENEAFRLAPTDDPSPRPNKGMRPGRWTSAPIDQLLGIRTGGNLAVVPNRIVLVAPLGESRDLANSTLIFGRSCGKTAASELVSWGRMTKDGCLVTEDGRREPMIAVTHSVDYMATGCRRPEATRKLVIVDGARGLAGNLQAYDDAVIRHRLLILSDHSELEHVAALADRECEIWAPQPATVLTLADGDSMNGGWFAAAGTAARNCCSFSIAPVEVRDPVIEDLHDSIRELDAKGAGDEEARRLLSQAWLILSTVSGWLENPGSAALDLFDRRIADLATGLGGGRMWLSPEVVDGLKQFLVAAAGIREAGDIAQGKREALFSLLRVGVDVGVVTRSVPGAARVRALIEPAGFEVPVYPISTPPDRDHGSLIVCSWPGRREISRLASRYSSPQIDVLTYPFESQWLSSFVARWSREWTRYSRSPEDLTRMTGLAAWPAPRPQTPPPTHREEDPEEDDPITRILSRRRKGGGQAAVPEQDAREGRYVGFHGPGYCFLTEGHKVPVLTDLVLGGEMAGERVPLRPVRKLVTGDFLLFRDQGDQDVISAIAEHQLGSRTYKELRRVADLWRPALSSIGSDSYATWTRLRSGGLDRSAVTVRIWLTDGDRIGPRSEKDLRVIAQVSGDRELRDHLDQVSAAIRAVWAAHIQAGFTLSELLLRELPQELPELDEGGRRVDFTFGGGWIVCIDEIAGSLEDRSTWEVNRLLFEEDG